MKKLEFPETIYANIEQDGHSEELNINAFPAQFDAVENSAEWQEIGVYKLSEIRRLRKTTEAESKR